MSRWFHDHLRRGGRVHHDGVSPRVYARLKRELEARARRRRAFAAGQNHAGRILLALLAAAALLRAIAWLWEL